MWRCDLSLASDFQRRYVVATREQSCATVLEPHKLRQVALTVNAEEFDPERMECINIAAMISDSPYEKKVVNGHEQSVLKGSPENSEAIVKVVAFPGLVVHRQGGGALAKRLLEEEEEARDYQHTKAPPDVTRARQMAMHGDDKLTGDEGFRTRVLCKSVVHLIWGRQRLLTKEAGTSAHLDAMRDGQEKKYEDDRKGFIELYDYFLKTNPDASISLG